MSTHPVESAIRDRLAVLDPLALELRD